jgi:hypothetical protein
MELTKYQKAYLLEYNWDVHEHAPAVGRDGEQIPGGNSCWLQVDSEDGRIFTDLKKLLHLEDDPTDCINVMVIASQKDVTCIKNAG